MAIEMGWLGNIYRQLDDFQNSDVIHIPVGYVCFLQSLSISLKNVQWTQPSKTIFQNFPPATSHRNEDGARINPLKAVFDLLEAIFVWMSYPWRIHGTWYICLHVPDDFYGFHVGKYTIRGSYEILVWVQPCHPARGQSLWMIMTCFLDKGNPELNVYLPGDCILSWDLDPSQRQYLLPLQS